MPKKNYVFFTFFFFIFLFLGIVFRLYQLKNLPFSNWDEAIYAQVAKEILQNKSLDTTFSGNLWLNKPPFSHFLIALSFFIIGPSEFWGRIILAIFGFLTLILTFLLSKKIMTVLFKKENIFFPLLSTLILASSPLFLERSTTLNTDIIIAFSYLGYFYFIDNFYLKTFFLVIGVWSKSLVGFFPLFFEPFFWLKDVNSLKKLIEKLAFLFFQVFFASLWYIYAFSRYGNFFLQAHFYDQIFKRIITPIELHFGDRFYYFVKIWQNFNLISLLFVYGYLIIFLKIYQALIKPRQKNYRQLSFFYHLIILIPLFYLGFLTLGKSKIYWYLTFIIPFLPLSLVYFFEKPADFLKKIILFFIVVFTLTNFFKQTFLFHPQITADEMLTLAACVKNQKPQLLGFLVDGEERKTKEFIKKNNLSTSSSFIYGGSPSFVFYSNKKIKFFYQPKIFKKEYQQYPLIVISIKDKENFNINIDAFEEVCQTKNWRGYLKKIP